MLGRLLEDAPLAGEIVLDRGAAEQAIAKLATELALEPLACAEGIVRVAEAEMLGALRVMSIERGIDPRGFALMPFGGAGPLHAAALAQELGITRILCPRSSGVLCALGLAAAPPRRDVARTVMLRGDQLSSGHLLELRGALLDRAAAALGEAPERARVRHELRYRGQSFELVVEEELAVAGGGLGLGAQELCGAFAELHEARYGYRDEHAEVELVTTRLSVWGRAPMLATPARLDTEPRTETRRIVFGGEALEACVIRGEPVPGTLVSGPALLAMADSTLLIPPGWSGESDAHGTFHLLHEARS